MHQDGAKWLLKHRRRGSKTSLFRDRQVTNMRRKQPDKTLYLEALSNQK